MQPTLDVLRERDSSATNQELVDLAAAKMGLSTEQVSVPHDPEKGTPSEVAYRMAWARSYLKKAGLLDNTAQGVWSLTEKGRNSEHVDGHEIARAVRSGYIPRGRVSSDDDVAETYLFAWNPTSFEWPALDDQIRKIRETGVADDRWSCGRAKNIPPGSRFFLIRLRNEPRGIVGSGVTLTRFEKNRTGTRPVLPRATPPTSLTSGSVRYPFESPAHPTNRARCTTVRRLQVGHANVRNTDTR